MIYANIVSTLALIAAFFSLGWQIYTWLHQKKREETPLLRVTTIKKDGHRIFYIQNIGKCGVVILSCVIDSIPIESYRPIKNPNTIIGAKVGPGNAISSQIVTWYGYSSDLQGKLAKIKCQLDSGKTIEVEYTLSEEQE